MNAEAIEKDAQDEIEALDAAELLHESQPYFYDETGIFWLWDLEKKVYRMCDDTDLLNAFEKSCLDALYLEQSGNGRKTTTQASCKAELVEAFRRVGRKHMPDPLPKSWIQFQDRLIDLDYGAEATAIPSWFSTNSIAWKPSECEDTPTIDSIFTQWVGPELVPTLYEIIAYCMLPQYPVHRMFCLNGSGSNGKGKFQELLMRFIGKENCCATDLDLLINNRFETSKLYRKLVCNMGETNFSALSKTQIIKRLTGQDLITFEHKFKAGVHDYNYAKLIINTNTLPQTFDKTDGFYRRWLIIDFPNKFDETTDVIAQIPEIEYSNLARKCIRILRELLQRRTFTGEGTIEQRRQRYEEASNPLKKFISLYYAEDINSRTPYGLFRKEFLEFLHTNGRRILTAKEMSNALKAEGFDIRRVNVGKGEAATTAVYIYGIEKRDIDNIDSKTDTDGHDKGLYEYAGDDND